MTIKLYKINNILHIITNIQSSNNVYIILYNIIYDHKRKRNFFYFFLNFTFYFKKSVQKLSV